MSGKPKMYQVIPGVNGQRVVDVLRDYTDNLIVIQLDSGQQIEIELDVCFGEPEETSAALGISVCNKKDYKINRVP